MTGATVYILQCRDGQYYVGLTRDDLEVRIAQHNAGTFDGWTKSRRPVRLVYSEEFTVIDDAIAVERRLKGWTRAKKEALIAGNFELLKKLSRNRSQFPHPSTSSG